MNKIANICDKVLKASLYLLVFALPLFFLPWTFEALDFNKQNLLIILTLFAGLAWLGKMVASRQVVLRRSFLNVLILLYVVIYTLATIFSLDSIRSFIGASGLEKEGLVTVLCFVVLYFVIINNFRDIKAVKNLLYSYILGAGLVTVWTLIAFLGVLPAILVPSQALNPVGTLNSLGIFLGAAFVLLCPLFLGAETEKAAASKKNLIMKIVMAVFAALALFLLATIDNWTVWAIFTPAVALILAFVIIRAHEVKNLGWLALPMAAFVVTVLLFFINTPIVTRLPAEIMPSFSASAGIARQTLREAPLLGSGPSTFVFDYAKFKPAGVNETQLWDIKFDRSASRVLTMLTTTGLFGIISWLFLIIFLAVQTVFNLIKEKSGALWLNQLAVGSAWFLLLIAKFLYSSNLTLEFSFWILTAILIVMTSHKFWEISLGSAPRISLILSFLLALGMILAISSFYLIGERYAADARFVQALSSINRGEDLSKTTELFNSAASLNQRNDVYLRNLAQSLQAQINQELAATPNEERAKKIQELVAADINVAKRATELSPKNSANWATLASIYQTVMPLIQGSSEWAISSWQKAIELEPGNPYFYTELGKTYASMADILSTGLQSSDEKVKADAETKIKENLAKAEEQLSKAIEVKADYAPAHFELALVYSRQGKIKEAISKLEAIKADLPNDIGVAFQLGLLYAQNKELDKAVTELSRAVELAPNFANARWYLAAIYEEQGKKDLALAQLEEILKTNPENETVKQKIDALKNPPARESEPLPTPIPEAAPAQ
ncbi:tetratricopeptide repeat protein [Candidatus Falkowbacteria bacterium]|nr:tetratricopeptide repeat protein [Candidatus Falkowbacteria bacterium]